MRALLIGLMGLIGIFCRYGVDQWMLRLPLSFPLGTFLINLLGSLVAGVIYVFGVEHAQLPEVLRTALLVGFCGGFTTFSAYALQSFVLLEEGQGALAMTYLFASPVFGLAFVFLGVWLARTFI